MSTSSNSNNNNAIAVAATGAAVCLGAFFVQRQYQQSKNNKQRRLCLEDLQGNSYATASDVARLYAETIRNKVIVITGTSSGLGKHTARILGSHGAHVIMGCRDPDQVKNLIKNIQVEGGTAECFALDLATLDSVKIFATHVRNSLQGKKVDVLINNAGVLGVAGKTIDGFQTVWQVNCMAPALLTDLLLPVMAEQGRVVNVSSEIHKTCMASSIVARCPPKSAGSTYSDYALSKACQVIHAHELNLRGVRAFVIEPGLVKTNVGRHFPRWMINLEYRLLGPFFVRTLDQGCSTILYCSLVPDSNMDQNDYYFANCAPGQPKSNCSGDQAAKELRDLFHSLWKDYLQPEQ